MDRWTEKGTHVNMEPRGKERGAIGRWTDDTDLKHDYSKECATGCRGGEDCRVGWIG